MSTLERSELLISTDFIADDEPRYLKDGRQSKLSRPSYEVIIKDTQTDEIITSYLLQGSNINITQDYFRRHSRKENNDLINN